VLRWFDRQAFPVYNQIGSVTNMVVRMKPPGVVPYLTRAMGRVGHKERFVFLSALLTAGLVDKDNIEPAVSAVFDYLPKADDLTMEGAVNVLAQFLTMKSITDNEKDRIIRTFKSISRKAKSVQLLRTVATGLGKSRMAEAASVLSSLLRHQDEWVRLNSLAGLGNLGKLASKEAGEVMEYAKERYKHRTRLTAIQALGRMGNYDAVDGLIDLLEVEDQKIRLTARRALRTLVRADFSMNVDRWRGWWNKNREKFYEEQEERG
jgi:HEAT repeat protein